MFLLPMNLMDIRLFVDPKSLLQLKHMGYLKNSLSLVSGMPKCNKTVSILVTCGMNFENVNENSSERYFLEYSKLPIYVMEA